MKNLFIAEKPSVAREFANALGIKSTGGNGYIEQGDNIVTWCVGHLVTMSYPDAYDEKYKRWAMETIPFVPAEYKYEIIPAASKQFAIVKKLLTRDDVGCIYVCTDSGREGEYIYRLVDRMAEVGDKKEKKRVWIDSQTEEEIQRGIREAKPLSAYDNLSASAYLRAQEDYLMGINFSRALTLKYSYPVKQYLGLDKCVIAVGRVMTCVLGMIVKREREIREFVPTPFYRVVAGVRAGNETEADAAAIPGTVSGASVPGEASGTAQTIMIEAEWKAAPGSRYFQSPLLYKENGFKKKEDAEKLIADMSKPGLPVSMTVEKNEKKTEKKAPPMLYNLAELQNDCSRMFKISPSDTLSVVQELYEKKLVTYPRTDARVLSTAVAKEIYKNISGLKKYTPLAGFAENILNQGSYKSVAKTKYVNDKLITDHYAIIPTGQGLNALSSLNDLKRNVYDIIAGRFLSIFYPPAEYLKIGLTLKREDEFFFANFKKLVKKGYMEISGVGKSQDGEEKVSDALLEYLKTLKKGSVMTCESFQVKEGETTPPKRYTSGTLILAMENAGQLIEDEDLRAQIKGSGIGTSATRDAIITKLVNNSYIALNKKTQVVTPTQLGEVIYDVVLYSINGLLRADLTASWEKGLAGVAAGSITSEEYNEKMHAFVIKYTNIVKGIKNQNQMRYVFDKSAPYYNTKKKSAGNKTG